MALPTTLSSTPTLDTYDVVIVGGAMLGSSAAWFLTDNPDFDGKVLVVEKDPSYEWCSTAHTNSCIRQQFSNEINIRISQFGAEFIQNLRSFMHDDPDVPELSIRSFGYMYLADNEPFADVLRANQQIQQNFGAGTKIWSPEEIKEAYPFYNVEDIVVGSHNLVNEGYFDGPTIFDWWKRKAKQNGAEYVANEVISIARDGHQVTQVELKSGEKINAGKVINASGPRAVLTAKMAGLDVPVEPRRRYTFIFDAAEPLDRDLPLTIDPSGVHMRWDGQYYLAGCPPVGDDPAVDYEDFYSDPTIWEEKVWPVLANRVPQFEAIKLVNSWVGHYAFNTLDQNAIIGAHTEVSNFYFLNGFSGHGFQQSPAMGRGISELITYGEFRTLDLSPLGYQRVIDNKPFLETAII